MLCSLLFLYHHFYFLILLVSFGRFKSYCRICINQWSKIGQRVDSTLPVSFGTCGVGYFILVFLSLAWNYIRYTGLTMLHRLLEDEAILISDATLNPGNLKNLHDLLLFTLFFTISCKHSNSRVAFSKNISFLLFFCLCLWMALTWSNIYTMSHFHFI